jgi:hypothetical protein
MPISRKDFFERYVVAPYHAWRDDDPLCEWKALATAGGINALIEHAFREANPTEPIGTSAYDKKLDRYRENLGCAVEHQHIKYVVETYKHVEKRINPRKPQPVPDKFDDMQVQATGPFSLDFSARDFDVKPELGFPYHDGTSHVPWIPLLVPVEKCIAYWRGILP